MLSAKLLDILRSYLLEGDASEGIAVPWRPSGARSPMRRRSGNHRADELVIPANLILERLPPYSPELNPQETIWDEIREKIFKNHAAKSMDEVCEKPVKGSLYIERNPKLVKSMTSFPYIASSL
jgi:hypothetical protein